MSCSRMSIALSTGILCTLLPASAAAAWAPPSPEAPFRAEVAAGTTVAQLVELALARNEALLAARQRSAEARGLLAQSGLRPNPSLEVSAGGGALTNSPGETEIAISYSHIFEMGGKRDHRVAVARLGLDLASLSVADRERHLRADVKARYGDTLSALRNLASTERLLELNRQSLRIAAARTREGEGAALEQALMQVEVSRLEADRLLFRNQVERSLLELKTLAGMRSDEPLQLSGELAAPALRLTLSEALGRALERRADLAMAKLEEDLGDADTALARTEAVPNIVAFGRYSRTTSRFDQYGYAGPGGPLVPLRDTDHILSAGVSISLPARNRNQGNIEAAMARRQGARLRTQYLHQVVRQEVEAAYGRFDSVSRALKLFDDEVVKPSERNLSVLRAAYDLGELRLLDVINEQRRFIETQKSYNEILRESFLAVVELERAVGSPLF